MPIKKSKFSYSLDLEELYEKNKVKPSERKAMSEQVGNALYNGMLDYLNKGSSPVSGGQFKRALSKEYAKKVGQSFSDLQLTGDMLSSVKIVPTKKGVTLKITDSLEKKKAFNHNMPESKEAPLPQRKWMPDDELNEKFKKPIMDRVKRIIKGTEDAD